MGTRLYCDVLHTDQSLKGSQVSHKSWKCHFPGRGEALLNISIHARLPHSTHSCVHMNVRPPASVNEAAAGDTQAEVELTLFTNVHSQNDQYCYIRNINSSVGIQTVGILCKM